MTDLEHTGPHARVPQGRIVALTLGALGVVYGDIGTSPLYAMRECFDPETGVALGQHEVLGVLSLIVWSLVLVVSVKYLGVVLRADNRGEGGVLALMALGLRTLGDASRRRRYLVWLGLFAAALLYGDGMLTPAVSVLSAVEGLEEVAPSLGPYVVPATVAIIVSVFVVQQWGTARIGSVFGPVVLCWFVVIAALGVAGIARAPRVLLGVNPLEGLRFFREHGMQAFFLLAAVFLVATGAEALYADMGHFGRRPIRLGWFFIALPALLLNYFGQGALLLTDPSAVENPFYRLAPAWFLVPLVILATAAAVIASQALISGAFSLTRQAVQLGFLPRLDIRHTSPSAIGQIYIPAVNWSLMLLTCGVVLVMKKSENLAGAYGVAVSTTMVITTVLLVQVARARWQWSLRLTLLVLGAFLVLDVSFWVANLAKIAEGGWIPLVLGVAMFTLMTTWNAGRLLLGRIMRERAFPFESFVKDALAHPPVRVPGTSIFMTGSLEGTPSALLHNIKNNRVLHENVVLLMVTTEEVPHVPPGDRVAVEKVGPGFWRIRVRYGFTDEPNVPYALELLKGRPDVPDVSPGKTSYFLGRDTLMTARRAGARRDGDIARWRKKLFVVMARNAQQATAFFQIPPGRVVEIGGQLEL